jgi:hypothetical protein
VAKKHKKDSGLLYLHCKCNSCKHWEIVYKPDDVDDGFYIVCATCGTKVHLNYLSLGNPHASIHWEKK